MSLKRLAFLALAVVCASGACGSTDESGGGAGGADTRPAAQLRIELVRAPNADPEIATVDCSAEPRATGYIDDAEAACRAVQENRALLLNGPPDNVACTQIYGGPERAQITGEVDGRAVRLGVSREDGCAIATWDSLQPILAKP